MTGDTYQCKCTACENHMSSDEFQVHDCPAIASVDVKEFGSDFPAYDKACKVAAEQWRKEQEMDEYTQHEVISEMSAEEKVENDIAGWGDTPETTDTHIAWVYCDFCVRPGKPWNPPSNASPVFDISEWKFSSAEIESGDIEDTFKDIFGTDFPAGDVHYLTGTREELEAKIYGEGEQA